MHRKSIGQTRRKQGEQGACDRINRFLPLFGKPGPVNSGEVLPNGTTTGVPSAAATCIGPVSLVSRTRHSLSNAQSSRREVLPAKFNGRASWPLPCLSFWLRRIPSVIRFAVSRSPFPPNISHRQFNRFSSSIAAARKRSLGHLLAGPYSAPAFKPTNSRDSAPLDNPQALSDRPHFLLANVQTRLERRQGCAQCGG